ncbi:hypothetical protein [Nonomuraea sp. NPDC050202]|uniref:hypothetical protein n=1 Tax=Nonomuraea sp. NPDC050202 TaxID=3155035 RepID=UPI0033EBDF4C
MAVAASAAGLRTSAALAGAEGVERLDGDHSCGHRRDQAARQHQTPQADRPHPDPGPALRAGFGDDVVGRVVAEPAGHITVDVSCVPVEQQGESSGSRHDRSIRSASDRVVLNGMWLGLFKEEVVSPVFHTSQESSSRDAADRPGKLG